MLHIGSSTLTLSSGSSATVSVCLPAGLYAPYACGGVYPSEVSWTVEGITGSADSSCSDSPGSFSINPSPTLQPSLSPNPSSVPSLMPSSVPTSSLMPSPIPTYTPFPTASLAPSLAVVLVYNQDSLNAAICDGAKVDLGISLSLTSSVSFSDVKDLRIRGSGHGIDGGNLYNINIDSSVVRIESLYIMNGHALYYGGSLCIVSSTVTILDCQFTNGTAGDSNNGGYGGNIYILSSTVDITGCRIAYGAAASGAGLKLISSTITMTNCVIERNLGEGSGFSITGSTLQLKASTISNNIAVGYGGGFYIISSSSVVIVACTISRNSPGIKSDQFGGAIYVEASSLSLSSSTLSQNYAGKGGALYVSSARVTTFVCSISENTATSQGVIPTIVHISITFSAFPSAVIMRVH